MAILLKPRSKTYPRPAPKYRVPELTVSSYFNYPPYPWDTGPPGGTARCTLNGGGLSHFPLTLEAEETLKVRAGGED